MVQKNIKLANPEWIRMCEKNS